MPLIPKRQENELDGDFARRRARFAALVFLAALPLSLWVFARITEIWAYVLPLEGAPFMFAATALGGVMAIAPVVAVVAFLVAIWYGVESVFLPRRRPTPLVDRLLVPLGLLVWFAPTLGLLASAGRAVANGSIAFSRPARVYLLASDPIAFWQSIGFLLIVAAALAYPSWHYWRGKLMRRQ